MRVAGVVPAAVLGVVGILALAAPVAVASGGVAHSYGGDSRSYGDEGGGGRFEEGDDEDRSGGRGGSGPEHFRHGVRAGEGGTVAGFDLGRIGLGTALVGGSAGTAYYLARRRTGEEAAG
ncbi:hypothetical protein ACF061_23280 [Streptomyces sp. NPDC015220]|uniref:hypothetical protein n=1 Tax=Streptomyces sp. NPDC015220 TaxID=3364947 RepID=UPI0036F85916